MSYITLYSNPFATQAEAQSAIDMVCTTLMAIDGPFQIKTIVETGVDLETFLPLYDVVGGDEWYFNAQGSEVPQDADWLGPIPETPYRVFAQ